MTWTKLSDDFSDDCWTLSDAAFRLHTEALIWSNRKLLNCQIPKSDLVRFSKCAGAADELVAVGWWRELGNDYRVEHHSVYQRDRETVVKLQKRNQKNGVKGGRPKAGKPDAAPAHPREVWGSSNPSGMRDGYPKGQAGQEGQDHQGGSSDWPAVAGAMNDGPIGFCRDCGAELTNDFQRRNGQCNRCRVTAKAGAA